MVAKRTGISRDLIIHPGETIAYVLEERGITQAELLEIKERYLDYRKFSEYKLRYKWN